MEYNNAPKRALGVMAATGIGVGLLISAIATLTLSRESSIDLSDEAFAAVGWQFIGNALVGLSFTSLLFYLLAGSLGYDLYFRAHERATSGAASGVVTSSGSDA